MEPMNFIYNLKYMGYGMLGVFIIIIIIIILISLINKFSSKEE